MKKRTFAWDSVIALLTLQQIAPKFSPLPEETGWRGAVTKSSDTTRKTTEIRRGYYEKICHSGRMTVAGLATGAASAATLDDVKARGTLNCGVTAGVPFAEPDANAYGRV